MEKSLKFLFAAAVVGILAASCESIPEGKAPEGPIIQEEKPAPESAIPGEKAAVNYMITSIATRCVPIASAGKDLPRTANEFTVSAGAVNDMPMEVWQSLSKMKLITPVLPGEEGTLYSLTSEFKELPGENMFLWEMRLLSADKKDVLWSDKIIFKAALKR
jgi:hypothetical protein